MITPRANWPAVNGRTARSMAPSRKCTWKSSGRRMVIRSTRFAAAVLSNNSVTLIAYPSIAGSHYRDSGDESSEFKASSTHHARLAGTGTSFRVGRRTARSRDRRGLALGTEPLAVEGDGAPARDDFDILKPQRLAGTSQQLRIFDRPAACAFAEHHLRSAGLGQPVVAPFLQREIGREEIAALLSQHIIIPRGVLGQRHAFHDAGIDKPLETVAQDVRRDADITFELIEAPGAIIGLAQDQDGPAVADHGHRARHGTLRVGNATALSLGDRLGSFHHRPL